MRSVMKRQGLGTHHQCLPSICTEEESKVPSPSDRAACYNARWAAPMSRVIASAFVLNRIL